MIVRVVLQADLGREVAEGRLLDARDIIPRRLPGIGEVVVDPALVADRVERCAVGSAEESGEIVVEAVWVGLEALYSLVLLCLAYHDVSSDQVGTVIVQLAVDGVHCSTHTLRVLTPVKCIGKRSWS